MDLPTDPWARLGWILRMWVSEPGRRAAAAGRSRGARRMIRSRSPPSGTPSRQGSIGWTPLPSTGSAIRRKW